MPQINPSAIGDAVQNINRANGAKARIIGLRRQKLIDAETDHSEINQTPNRKSITGGRDNRRVFAGNDFGRYVVNSSRSGEIIYKNYADRGDWNKDLSDFFVHCFCEL